MTEDPEFYAWLDGELAPPEAERMAAKVAGDPALRTLAEQHRALGTRLHDAFDTVVTAPLPHALRAAAHRPSGEVVSFAAAKQARERRVVAPVWRQAAAMAATLAVGLFAGNLLFAERASAPIGQASGQFVAAAALKDTLSSQLASAPAGRGARVVLTFRNGSGAICRSFVDGPASGLACREGGEWRIRGLFQGAEGEQGAYRMAAGSDPALAALVDAQMAGDPLDVRQEAAAKANGWR